MKFSRNKNQNRPIVRLVPIIGMISIIAFLIFNHNKHQKKQAERAYNDTRKALQLLVSNLDKGLGKIAHLNQFEITLQKIYNH
ncbi:hypothetical protein [Flagellimonas sp. S3867]|uniref:hypothetical protein n=1 Tax=Flagellimonas sp. S3867 TaxID=2768063 RepID=UPI001684F313|nr:hypothetical protein [Flagellimonas sp. S3867]